jgi:ribosomal protein S18 acetylase RimI-like enzyme
VVKDGIISEQGTHDELLAMGGTYRELYETQFRQAIDHESLPTLEIDALSTCHTVRRITREDISDVYALCKSNRKYYEYTNAAPTVESLTEIISRVPEGAGPNDKHFVGFYDGDKLVSVLDLITGYPESNDAFIGWFMVDGQLQRQGIGSQIFADIRAAMAGQGYDYMSLSCEKENEEAIAFWKAQGFAVTLEENARIHFAREI